jgi:hypothetical protein
MLVVGWLVVCTVVGDAIAGEGLLRCWCNVTRELYYDH